MTETQQVAFVRRYLAGEASVPTEDDVLLDVLRNALVGGATADSSAEEVGKAIELAESHMWDVFPVELPELTEEAEQLLEPVSAAIEERYQARLALFPDLEKFL